MRRRVSGWGVAVCTVAGVGMWLGMVGLTLKSRDGSHPQADLILGGIAGFLFLGAGVVAHFRRPRNRIGLLMVLAGAGWFAEDLQFSWQPWVFSLGLALARVSTAFSTHLVLAFPSGRLRSRAARATVAAAYLLSVGVPAMMAPFLYPPGATDTKPPNPLSVLDSIAVSNAAERVADKIVELGGTMVAAAVLVLLVRRWSKASGLMRWVLVPIFATALLGAAATVTGGLTGYDSPYRVAGQIAYKVAFCLLPLGFLAGVLRVRIGPTRVDGLLRELGQQRAASPDAMQKILARGLGDPGLRLGYWDPGSASYLDTSGQALTIPGVSTARAVTYISAGGERLAAFTHDPALNEDRARLAAVTSGAQIALERGRLLGQVQASRARIVAATDTERRRLGEVLHDGAQHHLVIAKVLLSDATTRLRAKPSEDVVSSLENSLRVLDNAISELRDFARGLHPVALTTFGLGPALENLASAMTIPVDVSAEGLPPKLPDVVASTAYFAVAEALTNTLKHASATRAWIEARHRDGTLEIGIHDNGSGGASINSGTGLLRLQDRVAALGGHISLHSPADNGTTLTLILPCDPISPDGRLSQ